LRDPEVRHETLALSRCEKSSGIASFLREERRKEAKDFAATGQAVLLDVSVKQVLQCIVALTPAVARQGERRELAAVGVQCVPVPADALSSKGCTGWAREREIGSEDFRENVVS
jgi:hypothetical protein